MRNSGSRKRKSGAAVSSDESAAKQQKMSDVVVIDDDTTDTDTGSSEHGVIFFWSYDFVLLTRVLMSGASPVLRRKAEVIVLDDSQDGEDETDGTESDVQLIGEESNSSVLCSKPTAQSSPCTDANPATSADENNQNDFKTPSKPARESSVATDLSDGKMSLNTSMESAMDSADAALSQQNASSLSQSSGTPILEGGTPSASGKLLPAATKFADGITEHLPFENLPNATGNFAKVQKIIKEAKGSWTD